MASGLSKCVGSLAFALLAGAAQAAAILTPEAAVNLPDTTAAADPDLADVVLHTSAIVVDPSATDFSLIATDHLTHLRRIPVSGFFTWHESATQVPEPATITTIALALAALAWTARRSRRSIMRPVTR